MIAIENKILKDKVAIVTGGGAGMGAATAKLFAEQGAQVVVAELDEETGQDIVDDIKTAGGKAVFVRTDVSMRKDVENMVKMALDEYGRLDVAVNNAARAPDTAPLADMEEKEFDSVISINLKSVALCLKYEIKQMMAQGDGGSIVNIASISGIRPQPGNPAYMASKHGVIGLTKSASFDYSAEGIRVNAIAPGAIKTPMLLSAAEEGNLDLDEYGNYISTMGRIGGPEEVAEANLWLVSEQASYVTGQTLPVDGGYTAK